MIFADVKHDVLDILFLGFLAQQQSSKVAGGQVVQRAFPSLLDKALAVSGCDDKIARSGGLYDLRRNILVADFDGYK
jgi:hypothetical protein